MQILIATRYSGEVVKIQISSHLTGEDLSVSNTIRKSPLYLFSLPHSHSVTQSHIPTIYTLEEP
jgi:hypothetical protein